jgi:hypothetical protein
MPDITLPLLIGGLTAVPFLLWYWIGRFVSRRRLGAALRLDRPWQLPTLQGWVQRGWLRPELVEGIVPQLSPSVVLYEWATADPEAPRHWRLRQQVDPTTPFEAIAHELWEQYPPAAREPALQRLREAVVLAGTWWGGAERGWNGRPLSVPAAAVGRKQAGLPLLPLEDLTCAPLPAPADAHKATSEGDGPDLVLLLAALRRSPPRLIHPLAPRPNSTTSLVAGLSTQVGTDVGRRVGASLGSGLGPLGSLVGQHIGGMLGALGGKALAQQTLPEPLSRAVKETETAISALGELATGSDFERAVRAPEQAILDLGKQVEIVRAERARSFRERFWTSRGQVAVEEVLVAAAAELKRHRTAIDHFAAAARKGTPTIAGGMILQNPWLVRALPGGVERLNAARATLNRAAAVLQACASEPQQPV